MSNATPTQTRLMDLAEPISEEPPADLKNQINALFATKRRQDSPYPLSMSAEEIPAGILQSLNGFLASVTNTTESKLIVLFDCPTCYAGGSPGRVAETEAGWKCIKC